MFTHLSFLTTYLSARFGRDERGATAVEYGLLVSLIAVAIIVAVSSLGSHLSTLFNTVGNKVVQPTP
jgi:pilus assembly protein Flp/PilA